MTFTCQYFDVAKDWCLLLGKDCVPGRPGCVARKTSVFLVPAEERIKEKEAARRVQEERLPSDLPKD